MPKLSLTEVVAFIAHLIVAGVASALVAVNPGLALTPDQQVTAGAVVGAYLLIGLQFVLHHVRWLRSAGIAPVVAVPVPIPAPVVVGTPVNTNPVPTTVVTPTQGATTT